MSAAIEALLSRIINDTNVEACRVPPAKVPPPLGFNNILDCLYRGHSDMPTELRAASPSVDAGSALLHVERGMGSVKTLKFDTLPREGGWSYIYLNSDIQGSKGDR